MLDWIKTAAKRVDFYAAHCYGRIQSCVPLSLFYAFDSLTHNFIRRTLLTHRLGFLPAGITFFTYIGAFLNKANETHHAHPDSSELSLDREKLIDTSKMIRNKLKEARANAVDFLKSRNIADSDIHDLLSDNPDISDIEFYYAYYAIFSFARANKPDFFHNLIDSFLHGITHLNEYLLLKYFAEIDLLAFDNSLNNVFGILILALGVGSAYQTFQFNQLPKTPSSDVLLHSITDDFRLFKSKLQGVEVVEEFDVSGETDRVKLLAGFDRAQKCYLSCN